MSEQWVVNASPLILLGKVKQLDLIAQLSKAFVVPEEVVTEILSGPPDDPARIFIQEHSVDIVAAPFHPLVASWDLGFGETAVLSYALNTPHTKQSLMTVPLAAAPKRSVSPLLALSPLFWQHGDTTLSLQRLLFCNLL